MEVDRLMRKKALLAALVAVCLPAAAFAAKPSHPATPANTNASSNANATSATGASSKANAQTKNAHNGTAKLVHVGLNPPACTGPFAGADSGVVNSHFNAQQHSLRINVSVHGALPNTTYVVDRRCVGQIGKLTTNSQGTGTAHVVLSNVSAAPGTFYIDISVLNGGGGAGNYGDTFIAGPFTLH
jgi:opacity protein-like surface antigen